jgi:hypothetical protein
MSTASSSKPSGHGPSRSTAARFGPATRPGSSSSWWRSRARRPVHRDGERISGPIKDRIARVRHLHRVEPMCPGLTTVVQVSDEVESNSTAEVNSRDVLGFSLDELNRALDIRHSVKITNPEWINAISTVSDCVNDVSAFVRPALYMGSPVGPFTNALTDGQIGSLSDALSAATLALEDRKFSVAEIRSAEALRVIADGVVEAIRAAQNSYERDHLRKLSDSIAARLTRSIAGDAVQSARDAQRGRESVGRISESSLAAEFGAFSRTHTRNGIYWLVGVVLLLGTTVYLGFSALDGDLTGGSWEDLIRHLLVALPCLGLAAYSARESSRHREAARWASRLAVQLKSISAYSSRLQPDSQNDVLASFGRYVFGPHGANGEDNQLNAVPPEVWAAVVEVAKARKQI